MPEDRVDIPTSPWERLLADRKRLAMVLIAVAALLFIGTALGVRLLLGTERGSSAGSISPLEPIETGEQGEGGQAPSTSAEDTGAPGAGGGTGGAESEPGGSEASGPTRAAKIAYRLVGELWVANEDGTGALRLATSERGAFALSPDGTTLAWVDAAAGALHLTDVASGSDLTVGPAEDLRPAWAPDSAFVAYTAKTPSAPQVHRVGKGGDGDQLVGAGHSPSVSADGASIAYLSGGVAGAAGRVVVARTGRAATTLDDLTATDVLFGGDGLVYAVAGSEVGSERIMTCSVDGSSARELVGATSLGRPVIFAGLELSPDGSHLVYAATGDDGFSRGFIAWLQDPAPLQLTVRRDTYPMRWSADGAHVYFVEGNSFQGERTSLLRVTAEGLGRAVVVEGAGL